ncbi:MAG: S-adenosylmethionine:tRNA ribosyltransferase-isomerase [Bacteroidales bacterium]|nr:S-adenosylmethionine:tRNA ribosyltransferase-isomerase [Bacteroidales bacterium]
MIPSINIKDFTYDLPEERIAKYPLTERDSSNLLHFKDGVISKKCFRNLADYIPEGSLMVFNDTKVVPARLFFQKKTGAVIEVFCLEPSDPSDYNVNFASTSSCSWKCIVGNARKWKGAETLDIYNPEGNPELASIALKADIVERDGRTSVVRFGWNSGESFSSVMEKCGRIPIPPYLNRETEPIDYERYQTFYAHIRGSVAAPTAGLHFTDRVFADLNAKGVELRNVCLHVGAGTFLPVKDDDVRSHTMHREPFVVTRELLATLRDSVASGRNITAVGTTSVRTLESLYYVGVKLLEGGKPTDVGQWEPYEREYSFTTEESLDAIIDYLDRNSLGQISVGTQIIIVPGFRFRIVKSLITNFHQPQSTLLLLISAFLGSERWRDIYKFALDNGFRFLSYGDSSLLFP